MTLAAAPTLESTSANDGLLYTVFQQLRAASNEGIAVAVTSANPGEGVTYSVSALVASLARDRGMRILQVDSRRLREVACPPTQLRLLCQPVDENVFEFLGDAGSHHPLGARSWEGDYEYRRDSLAALRRHFDFIVLDTPALKQGRDLFSLAPLVDGVLLVVEAGATRIDRILHAERSIDFARGKLLGHILNKRCFTVPHWLYKRL